MELVRFDTQLMQDAEISGVEYQQGTLKGYELREYLLEKWSCTCAYCGAKDTPLEIEHITPRVRGGSNRISNLTLACHDCNQSKGNKTAAEFGHPDVQAKAKQPLRDAAVVNSTRWALYQRLQATGLPVEVGSGGLTKFNRTKRGLNKTHWLDAACVGSSIPLQLRIGSVRPLQIKEMGHGTRQMCWMNAYGFPRTSAKGARMVYGFKTGDMVKAIVTTGKKAGTISDGSRCGLRVSLISRPQTACSKGYTIGSFAPFTVEMATNIRRAAFFRTRKRSGFLLQIL